MSTREVGESLTILSHFTDKPQESNTKMVSKISTLASVSRAIGNEEKQQGNRGASKGD